MKAVRWYGYAEVKVEDVDDPRIEEPRDAIVKITSTAICGSDLHLYDKYVPTMMKGDVLGHEPMGEVVEVGSGVSNLKVGDRVVVPFNIACGECWFCQQEEYSLCDRSNPNAKMAAAMMGQAPGGAFGYSHLTGGYPGGQAEYLRVPFADVGPLKIENGLPDEKVLFLSDIFPTGYMAAENANIRKGDTVAVWGCGPVGQLTIKSAWMLGAGRVIAIDRVPERLALAEREGKAETINFDDGDSVYERLMEMTNGRGPDSAIDCVGTEAHAGGSPDAILDKAKAALMLGTDRPHVLREAIRSCRKGGTVSVPGVYIGFLDKIPFGALMNKGITIKTGQTPVKKYYHKLLKMIEDGEIDPSFIITHRLPLEEAPEAYRTFRAKKDGCIKVVLKP
ncbi:MAG: glutathione-dependent formaldehyde dehydrogenase [Acidobacteria bacterium]|nr:glutathione-dependent formaldehyde dehydrogenase [Acidobacteriota bacterium]